LWRIRTHFPLSAQPLPGAVVFFWHQAALSSQMSH
jgi:hypothetical protein